MEDTARIAAFLAREFMFQGLKPEQMMQVAGLFRIERCHAGQTVYPAPPEQPWVFFILLSGKLQEVCKIGGNKKVTRNINPGDYFGEEALLQGGNPACQITSQQSCELLTLTRENFNRLLADYPDIELALRATMNSRRLARGHTFSWLSPDDAIYYITRKHYFFLFRSFLIAILFIVASIPLTTIGLAQATLSNPINFMIILGMLSLVIGIFIAIWSWLDWRNDYYIVTNQRVVWVEAVLFMYDSRNEAPLDTVLAVDVTSSWLGRFLDFGNVTARTYTGQIPMVKTSEPNVLAAYIQGLRLRAAQLTKELEEEQIKEALAQALERRRAIDSQVDIPVIAARPSFQKPKKQEVKKPANLRESMRYFLNVRYEKDGVIIYRKHWPLLVKKIFLPLLITVILLFALGGLVNPSEPTGGQALPWLLWLLWGVGLFVWIAYNVQDWRNDIYQLTPTQIIDIEKKPLGDEQRKSANLENILSIEHSRPNLLHIILNYGNVNIMVGETKFDFIGVFNPDRVHQDISDYQEALKQRRRMVEQAREKERMINWLVAYHEETGGS
jgi:hypothetical protein